MNSVQRHQLDGEAEGAARSQKRGEKLVVNLLLMP